MLNPRNHVRAPRLFETTAPANALSVLHAQRLGLKNYFILTSHVLVPPAMEAVLNDDGNVIQAFLSAGHVCTIMGFPGKLPPRAFTGATRRLVVSSRRRAKQHQRQEPAGRTFCPGP